MSEVLKEHIVSILTVAGYLVATGVINILFAHKSQINAWAEENPKRAAVLKLLRGLGFDPWMLLQSLSLFFKGKLPPGVGGGGSGGSGSGGTDSGDRPTPPDPVVGTKLHMVGVLALASLIAPGCTQVKEFAYPTAVKCGAGIADEALQTTISVLLKGENYKAALDELAKSLGGETGKAAVVCGVNELLDRWKTKEVTARSLTAPEKPVAVVNAEAFLAEIKAEK